MKRKMLSVLLVVLVVCLAASMLVLSACNPKEDDSTPTPQPSNVRNTADMLTSIMENLQGSYQIGESFGIDVSAAFVIDDKTAKDNDVTYTLSVKGNVDVQKTATDDKTSFAVELKKQAKTDEKATTLFGIAYEVIDGAPYFFGNVMGEYRKINAYSVTALYRMLTTSDETASASADFDISTILPTVISVLFGSTGTVENNVYTLSFDLAEVIEQINEIWPSLGGQLLGKIGMTQEQFDGYVKQFFGDLTYETRAGEKNVESLEDLFIYLQREMTFEGKLAFKFDQNNKFDSANLSFDYAKKDTPVANYTIRIDKAFVGTSETPVNVFADFALSQDERKNNEAINLLNFKVNGTVLGLDAEGNRQHTYEVAIVSDIDPFALCELLKGTDRENVLATLKKLGYFHFEVNEVNGAAKTNVLTLHSKFDEGTLALRVMALDGAAGVGGIYTFEEVYDLIVDLATTEPSEPSNPEQPEQPSGDSSFSIDKVKEVVAKVKAYLAYFTFDDVATNGVTVEVKNLVNALLNEFGIKVEGIAKSVLDVILQDDAMNFKLNAEYGTASVGDYVDTTDVYSHNALNFKLNGTINGLDKDGNVQNVYEVSAIADIDAFQLVSLIKDQSEANILATLKKLGYFHLEVNRVTAVGKSNVITLHSNFAEGKVIAAVKAYDMLGIGGEFTFEEIANIVKGISGGSSDTQSEAMTADDSSTGILDTIKGFLTFVNYENVATNGVTVEIGNIVEKVFGQLGVPYEGLIESLVDMLLVNDSFNVKFNAPVYGGVTAEDKIATENVNAHPESNFSILGTATGYKADGSVAHNYTIEVQSDLNLNALLGLIGNTSKENIVATLKQLGYFHLEINEVFDAKEPMNIITLHSNFAEGFAVVNVHTYGAIIYKAGVGGVYDFEALVDVIDMLINKPSEPTEPTEPTEPSEEPTLADTIKGFLQFFDTTQMTQNGVTFEIKNLVFHLLEMLGVDTSGLISTGIGSLLGSETMNVKMQNPTIGTCTDRVATDTIVCTIREASAIKNAKNDFIKEIKSVDGLALKAYKGTDMYYYSSAVALELGKAFPITGVNLKGEEVVTSGYIMGVKGLDINTVGKQNVTLYVAIANDVLDLSRAGLALGDDIPIAGALKFETEFEVLDPATVTSENISLVNTKTPTSAVLYTDKIYDQVKGTNPYMSINGIYRPIDESNMTVVDANGNAVELVDGKVANAGTYRVYFETEGFKSDYIEIDVESAYAKRTDGKQEVEQLVLGEVWDYDPYEVYVVTKDGENKQTATATYQLGSASGLANIFDITKDESGKDVYTLKKNLDFAGKKLTISFSKLTIAGKKNQTVKVEIPVVTKEGYSLSKTIALTHYVSNTVNGGYEITQNDVVYSIVWNGTAFEAVAADGSKLANFSMSLTWDTRKIAVELDAQGRITNVVNSNVAGTRSEKIICEIHVGDYFYTKTFTHYELYASNKTSHKIGNTLDGYISNVNNLYYVDENGEKQTLEFKYGAEGYAIYVKGTDTKVYDVAMTVTKDDAAVELAEGKFTETGKYRVSYTINVNGIDQTFYHDVTVK